MRKGFLIYEEMRKYLRRPLCHIWLCNCPLLNFLMRKILFSFLSVQYYMQNTCMLLAITRVRVLCLVRVTAAVRRSPKRQSSPQQPRYTRAEHLIFLFLHNVRAGGGGRVRVLAPDLSSMRAWVRSGHDSHALYSIQCLHISKHSYMQHRWRKRISLEIYSRMCSSALFLVQPSPQWLSICSERSKLLSPPKTKT